MAPVLAGHRDLAHIEPPGTLDGGDVLIVGDRVLIGISGRTNAAGAHQLGGILGAHGYDCRPVPVDAGLHLKSGVNYVGDGVLLLTAGFAAQQALAGFERIVVVEDETYACNTLLANGRLLTPAGFPATRRRLGDLGREIVELDASEFRKMDGGLTCLSLRF
jgi:dimethylargininase